MMKTQRLRDKYPLLYAFGGKQTFLNQSDAEQSDVHTRIRSIWPFAVRRVMKFHASLKPRERANIDPEDVLSDIYVMLLEKDDKWEPERGQYITYAGRLIGREFLAIRDRARTVQSPRNSASRIKEYQAAEEQGTLTERRRETYEQVSRTIDNIKSMPAADLGWQIDDGNLEEVEERDLGEHERKLISKAIRRLPPQESLVIGWSSGLWGSGYLSNEEIAKRLKRDVEEVREMKAAAYAKIRWYINARRKQAESAK